MTVSHSQASKGTILWGNDQWSTTDLVTRARNGDQKGGPPPTKQKAGKSWSSGTPALIWSICSRQRLADADGPATSARASGCTGDQLGTLRDPARASRLVATPPGENGGRGAPRCRGPLAAGYTETETHPGEKAPPPSRKCWRPNATRRWTRLSWICPGASG